MIAPSADEDSVLLDDRYTDDRPAGTVIGSRTSDGQRRAGVDAERVMAIDHGALRMQPLLEPGWGRQGIGYGPFARRAGLALAVFLLNGHNTSQSGHIGNRFIGRLRRWLLGSGYASPVQRLWRWLWCRQKRGMVRRLRYWFRHAPRRWQPVSIDENLAVGWFDRPVPADPLAGGNAFVMHATGGENGELRVRADGGQRAVVRGLQNVQTGYVVILREPGAAYYATGPSGAHGLGAYPGMRPLAIDACDRTDPVYPGVHQSVLGQIGFRVDTRVYGVRVATLAGLKPWYGTAQAADRLSGTGPLLDGSPAECGGPWQVEGGLRRGAQGAVSESGGTALLYPPRPSGLIHALLRGRAGSAGMSLLWRYRDADNHWALRLTGDGCRLCLRSAGREQLLAEHTAHGLRADAFDAVQILDDGARIGCHLNGEPLFGGAIADARLQAACGVGLRLEAGDGGMSDFEAHPRSVPIPSVLDSGAPWIDMNPVVGDAPVRIEDDFRGPAGDLAGHRVTRGERRWARLFGKGRMALSGDGAVQVRASRARPNPGRTAYTLAWDHPERVDMAVDITPPGRGRGENEKCRAGLLIWQDARHYLSFTTYLDDYYEGASVALFAHLDGFEELYDAVWTMVGQRIDWGVPYRLRLVGDGLRFTVYVDDEPVLYRALTDIYPHAERLRINRIGLITNWEWGDDTGSRFHHFVARG